MERRTIGARLAAVSCAVALVLGMPVAAAQADEPALAAGAQAPAIEAAPAAAIWSGDADTSWYNAEGDRFELATAEQVAGLAQIANGKAQGIAKDSFEGKTVVLAADIALNAKGGTREWAPIGDINIGQEHATATDIFFDGTFDGAGHKVEGLYIPSSSENYGGYHAFFGALGPHAIVRNLGIESGAVAGRVAAGVAAVSRVDNAHDIPQIIGCYNKAKINGNGATSRGSAGIFGGENQNGSEGVGAGYRAAAFIANCYNMGDVQSSGPCGGIAGTGSVKMYACYNTGAITSTTGGTMHGALMANLFKKGSVTASGFEGAGEIVNCYAYVGTDEWLYRVLDADHDLNDAATVTDEDFSNPYYTDAAAFLDVLDMEAAANVLGSSYANDSADAPVNGGMPLLWWQAGKDTVDLSTGVVEQVPNQLYTGSAIEPRLRVHVDDPEGGYDSIELNYGSDYRVEFLDNEKVGEASATVRGIGRFTGSMAPITFNIVQIDLSTCTIDDIAPQWFYGGESKPPVVVRTPDDTKLWEGEDYAVSYDGNDRAGEATVTVSSNGVSTTGQLVAHFHLVEASDGLEGSGTADDPYLLSSKADLQFLSHAVQADEGAYIDAHYRLTGDIDASAVDENDLGIDPIGTNPHPFAGTFDGAGHAITLHMDAAKLSSSLNFQPLVYDYLGLFSCTGSAHVTTIENLTIEGTVESDGPAAGFIGSAVDQKLVMRNCTNKASVTARKGIGSGAAGFIGVAAGTLLDVENCVNKGVVKGSSNAAGIVVYLNGGSGAHSFKGCGNEGVVKASESAGGVIQHYAPTSHSSFTCENCYNVGQITSTRRDGGAAGGILGMDQSPDRNADIDKPCSFISCYNAGTVSGGRHGGGIAGQIYTTPMSFKGCYNTGSVADTGGIFGAGGIVGGLAYRSAGWTFSSCYCAGTVTGSDPGAILGWSYAGSRIRFENCYYLDTLKSGASDVGGVGAYNKAMGAQQPVEFAGEATALSQGEMKARGAEGFAARLGSIFVDDHESPLNGGYPLCYWQVDASKNDLSQVAVAAISDQEYCGTPIAVSLDAKTDIGVQLVEGVDYELSYENNVEPGTATVTMTGLGRFTGQRVLEFKIVGADFAKCSIGDIADQWSTDTGAQPKLVVTNPAGNVLEEGVDYAVEYADNVETGTATAVAHGRGHYSGEKTVQFKVVKAADGLEGSGTQDSPYRIGSVQDFAYFMTKVNAGDADYAFACYALEGDLDLQPGEGQPAIGPVGTAAHRFCGQFDGAGHEIALHIDAHEPYAGLFGVVDGATVKNLTTAGEALQTVEEAGYGEETLGCLAAVVGYAFDALRLENCVNHARVSSNGSAIAGLVGIVDAVGCEVRIVSCGNDGTIETDKFLAAGLVGDARASKLVVRDSFNEGAVSADNTAAGLVGRVGGSVADRTSLTVSGSYNKGMVNGKYRCGGLAGAIYAHVDAVVRNAYNTAPIMSSLPAGFSNYLGGGIGANGGLVGGISANSSITIDRAYNAGVLTSADSTMGLGGLVGYVGAGASGATFADCYFAGASHSVGNQTPASSVLDGSKLVTDAMLKSPDMPARLGGEFGPDGFGENGGYPIIGIQRADVSSCRVAPVPAQVYTGKPIVPALVVFDAAHLKFLTAGADYDLACEDNLDVGGACAHVVGAGVYTGSLEVPFEIVKANVADCVIAPIADQPLADSGAQPALSITNEAGVSLVAGKDYAATYSDNTRVGTAHVLVRGMGNYEGSQRASFAVIEQTDISNAAVVEPIPDQVYTGSAIEPEVSVMLDGIPMLRDSEFTVSFEDNVEPGTAHLVVTGVGAFCGAVDTTFKIVGADLSKAHADPIADMVYTGAALEPKPVLTLGGRTLELGRDYALSYRDNVNAGTGYAIATGSGGYAGTLEVPFLIKARSLDIVVEPGDSDASASAPQAAPAKSANPMAVKAKAAKAKAKKLKRKAVKVRALSVSRAVGKVSFKKAGGSKRLSVDKRSGKVKVKKGTKKGLYKIKVRVSAAGDASHEPASRVVTVKVRVA